MSRQRYFHGIYSLRAAGTLEISAWLCLSGCVENEDPTTNTERRRPFGLKQRPTGLKRILVFALEHTVFVVDQWVFVLIHRLGLRSQSVFVVVSSFSTHRNLVFLLVVKIPRTKPRRSHVRSA